MWFKGLSFLLIYQEVFMTTCTTSYCFPFARFVSWKVPQGFFNDLFKYCFFKKGEGLHILQQVKKT